MYMDLPYGEDTIALCVSNPDWCKQLKGVAAGEKLKLTIEIDVTKSSSVINSKPLPMKGETAGLSYDSEKKEGKSKKVKEWEIRGKIVSMGEEDAEPDDEPDG